MSELLTMPTILQSIKPKYCELIASGKKTIEVRKTKPKIPTPFKVYIYETRAECDRPIILDCGRLDFHGRGQVIGEYICDEIYDIGYSPYNHGGFISNINGCLSNTDDLYKKSCLDLEEMFNYLSQGYGYGWHISDLKIYDKPKELNEFYVSCKGNGKADDKMCISCPNILFDNDDLNGLTGWCSVHKKKPLTRPPQSWCYVEEV